MWVAILQYTRQPKSRDAKKVAKHIGSRLCLTGQVHWPTYVMFAVSDLKASQCSLANVDVLEPKPNKNVP